ncbi:guanylyl cyclase [Toxoplasma gondii MAS]|uniref:adenylate cyclase n=2 Tax=Toxoplasma gondii TaxID=5811 RepID=A0A086QR06_TOXGO|nr:guanylyl cyclase [Toxoplasma gondii MAS]
MAKAMIGNITEVRERLCIPNLNMRIGLHYGSCVGGVIGSGRLRYDLWGMDVLTGNMMESNGVPGKINVSEILKNEMEKGFPGEFVFKFNKTVAVLQSTVDSYLIRPAKDFDEDEELAAAAATMAVAGPSASLQQGGGAIPQVQAVASGLRRDATSIRGNYRRRFTILGSAPRVLGRRQSLRGHQFSALALASHGDSGPSDEPRHLGDEGQAAGSVTSHDGPLREEVEDDEIDGLKQLRKEIECAGGLGLDASPSDIGSTPGSALGS